MTLADDIQAAVKSDKAILGYRESLKFLKSGGKIKSVIVAGNAPKEMSDDLKKDSEIGGAKVEVFDGTSRDLGTACGKPFPVAVLVIKG